MKHSFPLVLIIGILAVIGCNEIQPEQVKTNVVIPWPRQVVLTWQNDPATTMTITWRTNELAENHVLRYAISPEASDRHWKKIVATSYTFEETSAWLHTVELTGLEPNKEYYIVIEHPSRPEEFYFRTLPASRGQRELVFLAGGDSRTRRDVKQEMNELAIAQDPDFIIFDGDFINDALGEQDWDDWFDDWHEQMITADGRRVPIIPAIGNHEVAGYYLQSWENAPFFYHRFITPEPRNYYALEISPDMVLVTLDSDHVTEVTDQTAWLDSTLLAHRDKRWKLVQYHVAAWPSVKNLSDPIPTRIREHWIPVLERHNVTLVIEAHDHAYKKTVPIRNNQEDKTGVIYIGDGAWGAPIRETKKPEDHWWLEEALQIDHFWRFTLSADGTSLKVEPVFRPPGRAFVLEINEPEDMIETGSPE